MKYVSGYTRKFAACMAHCMESLRAARARWGLKRVRLRLLGGIPRVARRPVFLVPANPRTGDPHDLAARMLQHLDACACLDGCVQNFNLYPDVLPEFRNQAHAAQELAFALSLYPMLHDLPQLQRAHDALTRYWSSAWSTGGISDGEYRCALKSAVLYLQQRAAEARLRSHSQWDPAELLNSASHLSIGGD